MADSSLKVNSLVDSLPYEFNLPWENCLGSLSSLIYIFAQFFFFIIGGFGRPTWLFNSIREINLREYKLIGTYRPWYDKNIVRKSEFIFYCHFLSEANNFLTKIVFCSNYLYYYLFRRVPNYRPRYGGYLMIFTIKFNEKRRYLSG